MNTAVKLVYVKDSTPLTPFRELDVVRALKEVEGSEGEKLAAGSTGTVVLVWADGAAYEVEFIEPVQALATIQPEDLALEHRL